MKNDLPAVFKRWMIGLLLFSIVSYGYGQGNRTVSGKITDPETGENLPGVNVLIKGTSKGTTSNVEGDYTLEVGANEDVLIFSFIGYQTQEITIGSQTTIDISMQSDATSLSEVIVVGYGTQKKSDLTGAVASVKMDDIQRIPTGDATTALQGQIAGVTVTPASGAPGSPPVVRIRGLGTIGNNNPLYIIDGIPGDITYVNPADIETINVLKDASSATIYGARASNGVIIVTTKKGKSGKPAITFNSFIANNTVKDIPEVANKVQYNQLSQAARTNSGLPPLAFTTDNNQYANTDWADEYFQNGFEQKYDLGISGGADNINYLFSGGYYSNDGTIISTGYERFNTKLNLDMKFLEDRLSIFSGVAFSRKNTNNYGENLYGGNAGFSPILSLLQSLPHKEVYDPNSPNGFATPDPSLGTIGSGNPVGTQTLVEDQNQEDYLQLNFNVNLKLFAGISYQFQYGANIGDGYNFYFTPAYDFGSDSYVDYPQMSETRSRMNEWVMNNILHYEGEFGAHKISAMAGISRELHDYKSTGGSNRRLPSNSVRALSAGIGDEASFGGIAKYTLQSYFGRVNYNYDNKYLLEASIRRDGSSRFSEENKYGNFYSFSAGWAIHNESFFNSSIISELKPRFSYGILGNQNVGNHLFLSSISQGGSALNYPFGGGTQQGIVVGAISTSLPTPDIKWEETATSNLGLDIGLLNDKWLWTIDIYQAKTTDMLVNIPVPATSGITTYPLTNGGEMEKSGWEVSTTYREQSGDFKFDIGVNLSGTKNKVTKLGFADESFTDGYVEYENFPTTRTEVGGEIGRFYLFKTAGIFQSQAEIDEYGMQPNAKPGDLKFVDVTDDGEINDDDKTYFGSGLPKFEYGINLNARWKNFDISMLFNGTAGNKMYNGTKMWLYRSDKGGNMSTDLLNAWTPTNTNTDVFRVSSTDENNNIRPSDYFLEDASYIRLRNIQIGYTVPNNVLEKYGVSNLRIYAGAYNLFTITKYSGFDPALTSYGLFTRGVDRGYYPLTRSYVFGLSFGL